MPSSKDADLFNNLTLSDAEDLTVTLDRSIFVFKAPFIESGFLRLDFSSGATSYEIEYKYDDWSHRFSPRDFTGEVGKLYYNYFGDDYNLEEVYELGIVFPKETKAKDCIIDSINLIESIIDEAFENLNHEQADNIVRFEFKFPEHLKYACEQYLIYFGQFLRDAGEKVDIELSHYGERTLFSVIPEDKQIGLARIHQALTIYLQLSESRSVIDSASLAESRLQMVISGYQSQIMSLQAEKQAKNLELQSAKYIITNQQQLIVNQNQVLFSQGETILAQSRALLESSRTENILAGSLKDKQGETEDVVPGLVRVKSYDLGPIQLDIPTALRKVKEILLRGLK
ncbi:hypothetical protein [Deinococcus aestuarii]|uniref:hypothetical protein n=1 Tax=Deinococcus aestuarii TaxID=2774531 RepID=UPI001C0D6C24|nr:hypothetical protein [Deinococcus aestuarii]